MKYTYHAVIDQMKEFKPSFEEKMRNLENLAIAEDLLLREFFSALQRVARLGNEYGRLLSEDPEFKEIPREKLEMMDREFYSSVEPEKGYETCIANPDHAVKIFGDGLGQFCSASWMKSCASSSIFLNSPPKATPTPKPGKSSTKRCIWITCG